MEFDMNGLELTVIGMALSTVVQTELVVDPTGQLRRLTDDGKDAAQTAFDKVEQMVAAFQEEKAKAEVHHDFHD